MTDFAPFTTKERALVRDAIFRCQADIEPFYTGEGVWAAQILLEQSQDGNNYVYVEGPSAAEVLRKIAACLEEA